MRIGSLDNRIQLQRRSLSRDAQGQQVATYATYATVWAKKEDWRSREFSTASQVQAEITTRFTIRWNSDVVQTDRIIDDRGNNYNIRQILEIPRHRGLEVLATAIVS